jgi:hypothetical protein
MNIEDRERVIHALFDELASSSFAEGSEERIARSLEQKSDEQLLKLAHEKLTWTPT